jgi:hypothetical protein
MIVLSILGDDDVAGAESITVDQGASLGEVSIQGIEIADICIVLTFRPRVWAGTIPKILLGAQSTKKWGSSSPSRAHVAAKKAELLAFNFFSLRELLESLR